MVSRSLCGGVQCMEFMIVVLVEMMMIRIVMFNNNDCSYMVTPGRFISAE